jgi:hypothetical protein
VAVLAAVIARRAAARAGERVLGTRELNRTLLARQGLLARWHIPALEAVERLVGMQAQVPVDPYIGLWSRIANFDPGELGQAMRERRAVRASLMRATLHVASDRDALALRRVVQPVLERAFWSGSPFGRNVRGVDLDELLQAGRELVEDRPRTRAELRELLAPRWPGRDPDSLAMAITYLLPLVQVTPRGVWGESGQPRWTTMESWLGRPLPAEAPTTDVLRRYLAAFGPASVSDIGSWSGLTRVRELIEPMRPQLRIFRDDAGRELFDVEDGAFADPDTPAPPRFLGQYDNVSLGHADRTRIVSEEHRQRLLSLGTADGWFSGLLIDGFGRAIWQLKRDGERAVMLIRTLEPISRDEEMAVSEEATRLPGLLAPGSDADIAIEAL